MPLTLPLARSVDTTEWVVSPEMPKLILATSPCASANSMLIRMGWPSLIVALTADTPRMVGAAALVPSAGTGPACSVPVASPTTPPLDLSPPLPQPKPSPPASQKAVSKKAMGRTGVTLDVSKRIHLA